MTSKYTQPKMMGTRSVGAASLELRRPQIKDAPPNLRELRSLEVPSDEQRKGYATTLMHSVCREADKHAFVLMLAPQPYGDHIAMSMSELANWYAKEFGFVVFQGQPLLMARLPGSTPAQMQLKPLDASMYRKGVKHG